MGNIPTHGITEKVKSVESFGKKLRGEGGRTAVISAVVISALVAYDAYNEGIEDKPSYTLPTASKDAEVLPVGDKSEKVNDFKEVLEALRADNQAFHKQLLLVYEKAKVVETLPLVISKKVPDTVSVFESQTLRTRIQVLGDQVSSLRAQLYKVKNPLYTGIKVLMPNPKGVFIGVDTSCPPCRKFIKDLLSLGNNWTVGTTSASHFWLDNLTTEQRQDGYPLFQVVVNDKVTLSWVGYDTMDSQALNKVLDNHPKLKRR